MFLNFHKQRGCFWDLLTSLYSVANNNSNNNNIIYKEVQNFLENKIAENCKLKNNNKRLYKKKEITWRVLENNRMTN